MSGFNGKECHPYMHMVKNRISSTMLTKKVSYRCALTWNDTKSTHRVLGHSLVRSLVRSHQSLIRLVCTGRFACALRCAHSLAALHSFARLFCFCIHGDFTRTYTIYTICMKKKISFQFSFFFLLLHLWRFHKKIDNVESVLMVKFMEKNFFLLLFNGKGKQRYMRFLEMNMSRIDLYMNTKSQDKYNVSK